MKNYRVTQIRVHIGVQLLGSVVTSVDAERLDCTVERDDAGFVVKHKGRIIWIPDTNVIFAELHEQPARSAKAV